MMHKIYLTKSQSRAWSAFDTVGDPFGGVAYGECNDAVTAIVGSSVLGSVMGSNAASDAADVQAGAARDATAATDRQYQQNRTDMAPWREAGVKALDQINTGIAPGGDFNRSFTMADYVADPGLAFRLKTGTDAIDGSAAARGSLLSGGTLKALTRYGQDYGSQEYGKAYDRFNNDMTTRFNRLSSVAGTGQTATTNTANMGTAATESMNNTNMQGANATASGIVGSNNAITSGINSGVNGYMSMSMLKQLGLNGNTLGTGTASTLSGTPSISYVA